MLLHLILIIFSQYWSSLSYTFDYEEEAGKYSPSNGEVWPKPQIEQRSAGFYSFHPMVFTTLITYYNCKTVSQAVERYSLRLHEFHQRTFGSIDRSTNRSSKCYACRNPDYGGSIEMLEVNLTMPCEEYPHLEMDESYNLTVKEISKLTSASVWGILRGLETWLQLFHMSEEFNFLQITSTEIVDYPVYKHRGLLIDTGRHYLTLATILRTLDALEMNKMNVLHWHIVDDQSFPYQSEVFPDLSGRGAYHPSLVYTKDDIKNVVEYARDRGIRIIPEFDVPGHSRSWGKSFHIILTKCYKNERFVGFGPMNPISKYTYKLLRELFREVQAWFPDKYIHIGGDEVDFKCWQSNPELQTYTRRYGKNIYQMYNVFINKVMALLGNKSIPIVWQEVFDNNVPISHETLVQVWKYRWNEEMVDILTSGHRLVFSSTWYLDYLNKGWEYFYRYDPRQVAFEMLNSDATLHNIVGGEACMWGEMTDDANMMSRTWPRTSAVAERLWTGLDYKAEYFNPVTDEVRSRLEEQTCRMRRRGIHAEPPNGPGFCIGAI